MKFGYILPNYGDKIKPEELLEISKVCEEAGYDSVWATDHIVMPKELREPYGELLEPLTTLAYIAAQTEKLRVGSSCIVLPQRNPILVAKQAATLDVFSKGRLILGFGAGWAEKEFGFLDADFGKRGKVMNESIRLMRSLWKDDVVNFEGEFFHLRDALFLPKPTRKGIPVWIGGNGATALKRAIELGDGWHPVGPDVGDFKRGAEEISWSGKKMTISMRMTTDVRKKREPYVGVNKEKRVAVSGSADQIRKDIDAYADAGLEYYCASISHPSAADIISDLRKFASEVVKSYA
ncbi:MAG: LLM class F420-dependent oxidoreductase [Nitrososphaerota archaeon]|nr:LLM class F420-dependent oxidoreductase [Nitrososphaerota archaeon]